MKLDVMGVQFDNVTMEEALEKARGLLASEGASYVVTPNAEIVYEAMHSEEICTLVNNADLVLPDGAGVVLASKILKKPLKQKVAGVDFADRLLGELAATGGSVYLLGSKPGVAELAAEKMLEMVGLADRKDHYPSQMSGGQQQRVGIARAFIARPHVVYADEPTGNLDSKTTVEVMEMIRGFARKFNQTIIMVSHDSEMASYADRILTLKDGEIISDERRGTEYEEV
jgi:ABC-type dipeptide/oligopeptide/nickel transport system ATPase component